MKQRIYIHAATAISPQHSFDRAAFLNPVLQSENNKLYCPDAPYADYISPVAIRRMSRIMKMTISTAMQCLREAGVKTPGAIITGTGRGGVKDMESFVKDLVRLEEEALNPTAFIQSTYNSPNGWIAMQSGCNAYNQTYVHRGSSFELSLQDAQMLLAEPDGPENVLVGCYDELTDEYYHIRNKRGYWKKECINSLRLVAHSDTPGSIAGEGTAFFLVNNESLNASSCLEDLTLIHQADSDRMLEGLQALLSRNDLKIEDISLVMMGLNGDEAQRSVYQSCMEFIGGNAPLAAFKQLCGEYDTASGFGMWLADALFRTGIVPQEISLAKKPEGKLSHLILINHYILGTGSIMLLSKP